MSDIDFHRTQMGRCFYEQTMPSLVRELTRLNDLIERLVHRLPAPGQPEAATPPTETRR